MKAYKNYEVKIKISDYDKYRKLANSFGSPDSHFLEKQEDIFYKSGDSLLKLRIKNNTAGTLIFYKKSTVKSKQISTYMLADIPQPANLDFILKATHGKIFTIKKTREIFIFDNIRIHLDRVLGLGIYLEFEIIYSSFSKAKKQMKNLINHFMLDEKKFLDVSYIDLLIKKKKNAK